MSTSDSTGGWARPVHRLHVQGLPNEAINLNVEGRRLAGALQGFGPLWQKTYWARLSGTSASPAEVIAEWKRDYPAFWPGGATLYRALARLESGDVAVINASQGGMRLSTGVMVMYADNESFAFALPQGHILAGWITFSARKDAGTTVAQVQAFFRTSDPLYDVIFSFYFNRKEDQIWHHTLRALAARFGVDAIVQQSATCIDPKRQWGNAGNLRYNAGLRTALQQLMSPVRRLAPPRSGRSTNAHHVSGPHGGGDRRVVALVHVHAQATRRRGIRSLTAIAGGRPVERMAGSARVGTAGPRRATRRLLSNRDVGRRRADNRGDRLTSRRVTAMPTTSAFRHVEPDQLNPAGRQVQEQVQHSSGAHGLGGTECTIPPTTTSSVDSSSLPG